MALQPIMRHLLLFIIVCLAGVSIGTAEAAADSEARVSQAWKSLQAGKAAVLMRHALAPGIGDPPDFELGVCATQRNLSEAGRLQAVAIGEVLRNNGIAQAQVLSSQWCRCLETARLLNVGEPEPAAMLNSFFQGRYSEDEQTQSVRDYLRQSLERSNEVRVLVTHQVNISALTGQFTGSGDMLIVTLEDGEFVVLARVSTD